MRRRINFLLSLTILTTAGIGLANGCAATPVNQPTSSSTGGGLGGGGATATGSTGSLGGGPTFTTGSSGGSSGTGGTVVNPCGTGCGDVELCDPEHLGLDDNCDGQVDEGCPCKAGEAHFCFKGDPAYRGVPGCFDGTEICGELGLFSTCIGGVHAVAPDNCYQNDTASCHAIAAPPYSDVSLKTGTGTFSNNAVAGSEKYTVQCPAGVSQCPTVMTPDVFKPLQSGEYTVTYTKTVAGDPNPKSCTYPLLVGAPGLRIELSWEHSTADTGVDLDLHVHEPGNTQPWGITPPVAQDCMWANCIVDAFKPPQPFSSPSWFADPPAKPPTPVNWYLDPVMANNTCYNDPTGVGLKWASLGLGCHNPRLDVDNRTCDYSVTDPNGKSFCTPENINIDYPPKDKWTRIGVHYYHNHGLNYDVHPEIKIFCNGALAAHLGNAGYYDPETPVTFEPSDGATLGGNLFWAVADVAFTDDKCGKSFCKVQPIYSDPVQKTPFFTIDNAAGATFAPAYPAAP
ncbi:Hypothetical protein A7982_10490 [Minicystis rosea]|nr:Hypothetical protein A7982_10490 [Minicystis rosea]